MTERHIQLKALYLLYLTAREKNPAGAEKDAKKWLGRLARKLAEKGTNIFILSHVTEADQRGRNGKSNKPLEREEVEDLINWQVWLDEMMRVVEIKKEMPKMLVDGSMVMKETGLKQGVMLGVMVSWIFDDQITGEIVTAEEGLAKAGVYLEMIKQSLAIVEAKGLFVREATQKSKFKNPEDEILLWMKTDGAKEQVLEIMS